MSQLVPSRPICLIAEHNSMIGIDLEQAVEAAGLEPVLACSDSEAMDLLDRRQPAVAIIDLLPTSPINNRLASSLKRRNIPFVVHSTIDLAAEDASSLADIRWFAKPADVSDLLSHVRSLAFAK